ncbi:MAG: hypothetical protein AAGA96_12855 [Verrucomicrobiota bacterium]
MQQKFRTTLLASMVLLVGGYLASYLAWRKPYKGEFSYTERNSDGSIVDVSEFFPPTPDDSGYEIFYPLLRIDPFMHGEASEKAAEIWWHEIDPVLKKLRIENLHRNFVGR